MDPQLREAIWRDMQSAETTQTRNSQTANRKYSKYGQEKRGGWLISRRKKLINMKKTRMEDI
jgi:hypothetical protein